MGLELLAIALGLSTFGDFVRGRRVAVWSDITGSEKGTAKGACKEWDHSCIVHCLWLKAAALGIDMPVFRVPTHDNIADLPSREEYQLVRSLGASWLEPVLDDSFWSPTSWEALSLNNSGLGVL